jgi:transcriptional regulator with XRE-family HTH domain
LQSFVFLRMVASMIKPGRITGREAVTRLVVSRRGELGLTQEALAIEAGVSHRTVQYLEAGETWPQPRTLAAIARALGLNADGLRELADCEPEAAAS